MVKLLHISNAALYNYQVSVYGNEHITREETSKKLTRNMLLSKEELGRRPGEKLYKYGNLWFIVNKENAVIWLRNYCECPEGWELNKQEYVRLSKELQIEESLSLAELIVRCYRFTMKKMGLNIPKKT